MSYQASPEEIKRAKRLHMIFMFNLIVNHVFLLVAGISVIKDLPQLLMLVPVISLISLTYIIFAAKRAASTETSWFVQCHWMLAAKRARIFVILLLSTVAFIALVFFGGTAMEWSRMLIFALIGAVSALPFMITLLTLLVLEYDADHQCSAGKVPAAAAALNPQPANP